MDQQVLNKQQKTRLLIKGRVCCHTMSKKQEQKARAAVSSPFDSIVGKKTNNKISTAKKAKPRRGGWKIVCRIESIEQDASVKDGLVVLETTDAIGKVTGPVDSFLSSSKMTMRLKGKVDDLIIAPQKGVNVMARNLTGGSSTFTMPL